MERNNPSSPTFVNALANLRKFNSNNKLKDAIHTYITNHILTSKDTKELREAFKFIDTNGDGKLSREELLAYYTDVLGPSLAETEVDRIMSCVDTDNNGFIDCAEFIKASSDQ